MRIYITAFICILFSFISFLSVCYPLTQTEQQQMIEASKEGRYDIVSKIMMKEYKENCALLKNNPKKSNFKSVEQLLLLYSEAFTKLYLENAKKNGYLFKTQEDIGMIKVRFIMELYDIYKSI